jgi:hypothetical protein
MCREMSNYQKTEQVAPQYLLMKKNNLVRQNAWVSEQLSALRVASCVM